MLQNNQILSFLNIADNRIGNEGLLALAQSLSPSSPLVSLNLQNNDLDGQQVADALDKYLRLGKNLIELNLSHNKLGDASLSKLAIPIGENVSSLKRLFVVNTRVSAKGAGDLFYALKSNSVMEMVDLSNNNL